MGNIIVGSIIVAILGGAAYKMYWNKKHNVCCSGCPSAKSCSHKCH